MRSLIRSLILPVAAALVVGACGGEDDATAGKDGGKPSIAVTTNILGDVVSSIVGDSAEVTTIMPVGANPHDFQASAQEAAAIRAADLLVVNGGGFEEGLLDLIDSAEEDGVAVVDALASVEELEGDSHGDEEGHDHGEDVDPHFFTDPVRMIAAVEAIADAIIEQVRGVDAAAVEASTADYVADLEKLDAAIESEVSAIPSEKRVLVTNHEVFGYFADRYGFEIVGTVVPGGSTEGGNAKAIAELAEVVREHEVPAIFADTSAPDELAQTLAREVGDLEVVELFSESLGGADSEGATYLDMMRTNASRIAEALT